MRLRIAHQLSLLILTAVVLAVLAVGAVSLWNLRNGFADYLRLRDEEQLDRFVTLLEQRATVDPSMEWLRGNRQAQRAILDELHGRPPPGLGRPPPPLFDDRPPSRGRGLGGELGDRLFVRDAQGNWLAGRPQPPGLARTLRTVRVNGTTVATVELTIGPAPEGLDARFLQRQSSSLLLTAMATIVLSVLAAWWVAGRWSRPLRELQLATRRISRGEQGVTIALPGTPGASSSGAVEIDELVTDVRAMVASLATLEESRRQWIAQISHELRTPLAVLRGELESIEDGARQPTPMVMASLREEAAQLTRLVDDLHTLAVADIGRQSGVLNLKVEDSAPGVSPQHMPKLFDPLFRVDAARSRTGHHGSGLGLSIVRAIVRAHRGHVEAVAGGMGGLAIQVALPLAPQHLERRKRQS